MTAVSPGIARTALLAAVVALAAWSSPTVAHQFTILDTVVTLESDGTWRADLRVDVDALALGASPATPSDELARACLLYTSDAADDNRLV